MPKLQISKLVFRKRRTTLGSSFVEFAVVLVVSVPIVLSVIDLGYIALGAQMNDTVARDAARAAAEGPPAGTPGESNKVLKSSDQPYKRAEEVVENFYCTNIPAKVREVLNVTESLVDLPPNTQGGAVDGQIAVETTVDIYPPFLIGGLIDGHKITLAARHNLPYTYVVPMTVIQQNAKI
jgi:Flp pilus assembly protein TadG